MWKWLKLALAAGALAIIAFAALAYVFGPFAQVLAVFDQYRQSQVSGDRQQEAAVMSPEIFDFYYGQRLAVLNADKSTLAALPFMERTVVLSLRNAVRTGQLSVADFQTSDKAAFFLRARGNEPPHSRSR